MKSSSGHAGYRRKSAANDNAEVVIKPHLMGANLIDSIGRWGGAKMKKATTGQAIILVFRYSLRGATIPCETSSEHFGHQNGREPATTDRY
jgi:hypothetical protein